MSKKLKRLPCDNLQDFIYGLRHYYTVYDGNYKEGEIVVLYNDYHEELFVIRFIIHHENKMSLGLIRETDLKKINSYYAGTNPLD